MPHPEPSAADARFMAAAIRLGRRELGRTWPNPAVGCLVVAPGGRIVARGWTCAGGRPHAERVALAEAGAEARGATAYVSLEPCAHHGSTPPCAEALVEARVARVVTALDDPDPRVRGRGHATLAAAGIEVVTGVLAEAAWDGLAGHVMRATTGRPWVTLKLAISRDGCIAGPEPGPVAITGREARARAHMLRATHDAILVGIGTALADDPLLTCRLPGMADRSPVRVVLDTHLRLGLNSRLVRSAASTPLWLVAATPTDSARTAALEAAGARVLPAQPDPAGGVDIAAGLTVLADQGITRLLVEGGAGVAGALVGADLVDEAVIFEAQLEIGPGGLPAIAGGGLAALAGGTAYRRVDARPVGDDLMSTYLRVR